MKADTVLALETRVPPPDDEDVARTGEPSLRAGRAEFARTLTDVSPEEPRWDLELESEGEGDGRSRGESHPGERPEQGAPRPSAAPEPAPPQPILSAEPPFVRSAGPPLVPSAEPPAGEEGSAPRVEALGRASARMKREMASRLRDELSETRAGAGEGAVLLAVPSSEAATAAPAVSVPAPAAPVLVPAAREPGLDVAVLARAAHIVVGTEDGKGLELHLRLTRDGSEIRAAGALVPVIRARLAELEVALAAQGVPLTAFEVTASEAEEREPDPDEEKDEGRAGRRDGAWKSFRIKA